MCLDDTSRSSALADDQEPTDAHRLPPEAACHQWGEAHLAIERHQGRLQIAEGRLHLDDQKDPLDRMPGEDVDRSPIAANLKARFGLREPSSAEQLSDSVVNERRVRAVEQPVDRLASPIDSNDDSRIESSSDPLDHIEPKLTRATKLE